MAGARICQEMKHALWWPTTASVATLSPKPNRTSFIVNALGNAIGASNGPDTQRERFCLKGTGGDQEAAARLRLATVALPLALDTVAGAAGGGLYATGAASYGALAYKRR